MELHTNQLQIGVDSAVAAQLWAPQNAYMCPLMVISQKRCLKRCCISVINRHDLVVAVLYPAHGYSTGGP